MLCLLNGLMIYVILQKNRRLLILDTLRRFHIEEENASGANGASNCKNGSDSNRDKLLNHLPTPFK